MRNYLFLLKDLFSNVFFSKNYDLFYVVENANWVTDCEWKSISDNLNKKVLIRSRIISTSFGLRNKIIHFGSVNTFIGRKGPKNIHKSNKIILTWFHIVSGDKRLKFIPDLSKKVSFFHTSCEITRAKLIQAGVDEHKIITVPLGIDLNLLKPGSKSEINKFRQNLKIGDDQIIIGSFQKDGAGWGAGNSPKLVKGPDIFCDVVELLSKKYSIHVLLTGPARGYVINRLKRAGINYTHVYLSDFYDILPYYQVLDLYLVCSREEGGPKALLESMACSVPLVATKVGMVPEVIIDGQNGYLTDIADVQNIYNKSCEIIDNQSIRSRFCNNGLETIKKYSYDQIAKIYWDKIYSKLI